MSTEDKESLLLWNDSREIVGIKHCVSGKLYEVGKGLVTKIEVYKEYGIFEFYPVFVVYIRNEVAMKIPAQQWMCYYNLKEVI